MPQGTIRDFDLGEREGSLLMDDRTEVLIDATSDPAPVSETPRQAT